MEEKVKNLSKVLIFPREKIVNYKLFPLHVCSNKRDFTYNPLSFSLSSFHLPFRSCLSRDFPTQNSIFSFARFNLSFITCLKFVWEYKGDRRDYET